MPTFPVITTPLNEDLVLPIPGRDGQVREYSIAPPRADEFIRISALNVSMAEALSNRDAVGSNAEVADLGVRDVQGIILGGDVLAAMVADGILASDLRRAVQTANQWIMSGCDEQAALEVWNSGKAQAGTTPSGKTGAAAGTTKPRTSGSGTSSQTPTRSTPAPRSRGGKSGSTST